MEELRPLNSSELALCKRLTERGKLPAMYAKPGELLLNVRYGMDRNFTIAVVTTPLLPDRIGIGAAKRNPTDKVNPEIGKMVALSRTLLDNYKQAKH